MTSKVQIKKIYRLVRGTKKDGSGEWVTRKVVLTDYGCLNPDERPVKMFGSVAESFPWHEGDIVQASWQERVREYNDEPVQENILQDMRNNE